MHTLYFDSPVNDEIRRQRLYEGQIFVFSSRPSTMQFRESISQHIKKWNLTANPSISVETKKKLIEVYREDVLRLQELIQRDLSKWVKEMDVKTQVSSL